MAFEKHTYENGKTVITAEIMEAIENELITLRKEMGLASYPIGAVYMSAQNTNPSSLLGGTWIAWGSGRVPVGVDASQSEFNTVEKTGGSKYMQKHTHSTPNHTHILSVLTKALVGNIYNIASQSKGTLYGASGICKVRQNKEAHGYGAGTASGNSDGFTITASHNHPVSQTSSGGGTTGSAGDGNAQNLPPYITCYMFKRTA